MNNKAFKYKDSSILRKSCAVCSVRVYKFYVFPVVNEYYSESEVNGYKRYALEKRIVCTTCADQGSYGFEKVLIIKKRTNND